MTRPCTCRGREPDRLCVRGREPDRFCVSHRIHRRVQQTAPGQALFNKTAPQLLKRFRDLLSLLKIPGSERLGFTAFRAGTAMDLAKSGCPVHIIMMMGQWRFAAMLHYVSQMLWMKECFRKTCSWLMTRNQKSRQGSVEVGEGDRLMQCQTARVPRGAKLDRLEDPVINVDQVRLFSQRCSSRAVQKLLVLARCLHFGT